MRCLLLYLSAVSADDPKRPAGAGTSAGLVQNDGQLPSFLTAPVTGGVGYEDLFILDAPQHDKMSGLRKMSLGHQGHDQLSICHGIQNALRFRSGTPFNRKPPRLCRAGDQSMVGAAFAAPIAILIGPRAIWTGSTVSLVSEETTIAMEVGPQPYPPIWSVP